MDLMAWTVMSALQGRLEQRVLLVFLGTQEDKVLLAIPDLTCQERKEKGVKLESQEWKGYLVFQEQLEMKVYLGHQETPLLASLEQPDLVALKEIRATLVNPQQMAFQSPLVIQVTLGKLEVLVCLEWMENLEKLDHGEKVEPLDHPVNPERLVNKDLKVYEVQWVTQVYQGHQEAQENQENKDKMVRRELLEGEELMGLKVLRESQVKQDLSGMQD